ncbi:MAG: hypothetical protein JO124_16130 [Hyphomicrobiales bacterium]|nr:hypothetical protein [Hyphomicrobiales bacterium]
MIHFMLPLPPVDLLALYWSRQVCIRCFPADSLEYLGDMAVGKTGAPAELVEAPGTIFFNGLAIWPEGGEDAEGVGRGVEAAGAADGAAAVDASPAHCVFWKSFHFIPLRVPASFAALYFALHSLRERASAGLNEKRVKDSAPAAIAATVQCFVITANLPISLMIPQDERAALSKRCKNAWQITQVEG